MNKQQHLLTSKQMAQFVTDGFLRFDRIVSDHLNRATHEQMDDMTENDVPRFAPGTPLRDTWPDSPIGEVFRLPELDGIIRSLVGPDPLYDHHAIHTGHPGNVRGQSWHADAIIDLRMHFDVQFFYFASDTPREMGGTLILPGSHFRRISESDIARYQNFRGQMPVVCDAGSILVVHHGIWHCAQPNHTGRKRYMFKLRLNPTVRQQLLWNTDDLEDPQIPTTLSKSHAWYGNEDRIEIVNRIKFWRFLTSDDQFDVGYWLTRIENMPEAAAHSA